MPQTYRAALVGCSRMGAFIDNETRSSPSIVQPYSHAAGYEACSRTDLVAGCDLRPDVLQAFGERYGVGPEHRYTSYQEMIERGAPGHPEHRHPAGAAGRGDRCSPCSTGYGRSTPRSPSAPLWRGAGPGGRPSKGRGWPSTWAPTGAGTPGSTRCAELIASGPAGGLEDAGDLQQRDAVQHLQPLVRHRLPPERRRAPAVGPGALPRGGTSWWVGGRGAG